MRLCFRCGFDFREHLTHTDASKAPHEKVGDFVGAVGHAVHAFAVEGFVEPFLELHVHGGCFGCCLFDGSSPCACLIVAELTTELLSHGDHPNQG